MQDYTMPETEEDDKRMVEWYNKKHNLQLNPDDLDEVGSISVGGFSNYGRYSI